MAEHQCPEHPEASVFKRLCADGLFHWVCERCGRIADDRPVDSLQGHGRVMTRNRFPESVKDLCFEAFMAGFKASSEGYNGEVTPNPDLQLEWEGWLHESA